MERRVSSDFFPFITPTTIVGESRYRLVKGYEVSNVVTKSYKNGIHPNRFTDIATALEDAKEREKNLIMFQQTLTTYGHSKQLIPPVSRVVYRNESGDIALSEVQPWYKNATSLQSKRLRVLSLPDDSLTDLKALFRSARMMAHDRRYVDIVGSTTRNIHVPKKVLRKLFPLFYSENIVIDSEGTPRFIDVGSLNKKYRTTLKGKISARLDSIGALVSIGIINTQLQLRKLAH